MASFRCSQGSSGELILQLLGGSGEGQISLTGDVVQRPQFLRELTDAVAKISDTPADEPSKLSLGQSLWAIITELQAKGRLQEALTLWMRLIVLPPPALTGFDKIDSLPDYFEILSATLQQCNSINLQKYCLAILQESIQRLSADVVGNEFSFEAARKDEFVKAYNEYCSLFEIIVMGRALNQIQACLEVLPTGNKDGRHSLVGRRWWLILYAAALQSNNENIPKLIGTWLLENYVPADSLTELDKVFVNSLLDWATNGALLWKSIKRDGRNVKCTQGDLLSDFCRRLGIGGEVFAHHVLNWLNARKDTLNQHSTAYILQGLAQAKEYASAEIYEAATQIAEISTFTPIQRHICRTHCLSMMEQVVRNGHVPADNGNETSAISALQLQIKDSEHWLTGDLAGLVGTESFEQMVKQSPGLIYDRLSSFGYVSKADAAYIIHWDRIHRYEPHQAHWRQLATVWPHWANEMLASGVSKKEVGEFIADTISNFSRISRRKMSLWAATAQSLRHFYLNDYPSILQHPTVEEALLTFLNDPPVPRPEYLLDAAIVAREADENGCNRYKLAADETLGNAYIFDLLGRLRVEDHAWGIRMLDKLLEPWIKQKRPVAVNPKWKRTSQLQAVVLLVHSCVKDSGDIKKYYQHFHDLVTDEPNPRPRYLLEWLILRLASLDEENFIAEDLFKQLEAAPAPHESPKLAASQMRLLTQIIQHMSWKDIAAHHRATERLLSLFTKLQGSPRIAIRFEAQASFPFLHEFAERQGWKFHTVFGSISAWLTTLDKWKEPPEDRVLHTFQADRDMNLTMLFEGGYIYAGTPEPPNAFRRDFEEISNQPGFTDGALPIGEVPQDIAQLIAKVKPRKPNTKEEAKPTEPLPPLTSAPLQTKALLPDLSSLNLSNEASPNEAEEPSKRGSGPILIGSLLDTAVNLGGLSRAANVFGCHSLHLPDLKIMATTHFRSTSVDSENHIGIVETKSIDLRARLEALKAEGWTIVGLEQTSESEVIGVPGVAGSNSGNVGFGNASSGIGGDTMVIRKKLPRKAVIVMGAEKTGIPAEILFVCDQCVEIKQWGVTRSLNVQTAAACVLFEWRREWGDGS